MGTRHLVEVKLDGEIKVAQYGQWDGYLSGQGLTIAQFLQSGYDTKSFAVALSGCRFTAGADESMYDWLNEDGREWQKIVPHLSRDTGAKILWCVYGSHRGLILKDSRDFKKDSVMCEYHYLIDLDKNTVTINNKYRIPFAEFTPELCEQDEETVFAKYALLSE